MVVLRIAIGWHLCYEGLTKLESHSWGTKPFSSEMYLRNSSGPFRDRFREIVGDMDGQREIDANLLVADWTSRLNQFADRYAFSDEQRKKAQDELDKLTESVKTYLQSEQTKQKVEDYKRRLGDWYKVDDEPLAEFEATRHRQVRGQLDALQKEIARPILDLAGQFEASLQSMLTTEQRQSPDLTLAWEDLSDLDKVDKITMYGLAGCGALMMAGLFSRLASLGAAGLLLLFYISMPPWPGLPPNPTAEGNYLIVNKNLIEMIACLMLATSPSGVWGGLDSIIRGFITRPWFGKGADELREQMEEYST